MIQPDAIPGCIPAVRKERLDGGRGWGKGRTKSDGGETGAAGLVLAAIVFVIIKNAIRNCKLENGRERAGRPLFMGCSLIFMRRN